VNGPAVFSFLKSYGPNTIYNTLRLQTHSCNIERGVLESSEKHVFYFSSACFSRLVFSAWTNLPWQWRRSCSRETLPAPQRAATVLAPAWRSPVGAAAPESVPVRGQEPGGNNHGGYRGPSWSSSSPHTSRSSARRHELAQAPRSPCLEDSTVAESDSNGTASDANPTITGLGPELARHRRRGPPAPPRKQAPLPPP